MNNSKINRRKFVNSLLGISGLSALGTIIYPVAKFLIPPKIAEPETNSLKVGKLADFELNSSKIIKFGRTPVILIRQSDGKFAAFAATCTHLDCIVQYRKDTKQIVCACHNGIYDMTGRNISGPPPKPLQEFNVEIINDEILITT